MALSNTKEILKRLNERYGDTLRAARLDIKPDYSRQGFGISSGVGYSYVGVDDMDRDFIYQAIGTLAESVNERPIIFDIDHYITEAKAVRALDEMGNLILEDLLQLRELKIKYKDRECSHYPLNTCLAYHEEVYSILDEIFKSDEYVEFKNPGKIEGLSREIDYLKFQEYWRKRKWKYIIHLLAFFPFLFLAGWTFFHKDKHDLIGLSDTIVLVFSGLLTIVFNIFFNNHNSFKDSWKLLSKASQQRLKDKEELEFKKQKKSG